MSKTKKSRVREDVDPGKPVTTPAWCIKYGIMEYPPQPPRMPKYYIHLTESRVLQFDRLPTEKKLKEQMLRELIDSSGEGLFQLQSALRYWNIVHVLIGALTPEGKTTYRGATYSEDVQRLVYVHGLSMNHLQANLDKIW